MKLDGAFFTLTGLRHYIGSEDLDPGDIILIKRDCDNEYDENAIMVLKDGDLRGYVANNKYTALCGSLLAGDMCSLMNPETFYRAVIEIVFSESAICRIRSV